MEIETTGFNGLFLVHLVDFHDARGAFQKPFNQDFFQAHDLATDFQEGYYSVSSKDVLRGMHFQTPPADHAKLVYVSKGRILDVALDLRKGSPTYGESFARELSSRAAVAMYLPRGFAHGFRSLEDGSITNYLQTSCYDKAHDGGVRLDSFGFDWGIEHPILSERDKTFPALVDFDSPFVYEVMP